MKKVVFHFFKKVLCPYLLVGGHLVSSEASIENDAASVGPDWIGLDVSLLGVPHVDAAGVGDDVTHPVTHRHKRQVACRYSGHRRG